MPIFMNSSRPCISMYKCAFLSPTLVRSSFLIVSSTDIHRLAATLFRFVFTAAEDIGRLCSSSRNLAHNYNLQVQTSSQLSRLHDL